jgi:hypothetical protein
MPTDVKKKRPYEPPKIYELEVDLTQAMGQTQCSRGLNAAGACRPGKSAISTNCKPGLSATVQCNPGNRPGLACRPGNRALGRRGA